MKNNKNAKKEISRDEYIKIRVSKEEKELFYEYAKEVGIPPTRFARNILMMEARSKINKIIGKPVIKAYKYYLQITNQEKELNRISTDE